MEASLQRWQIEVVDSQKTGFTNPPYKSQFSTSSQDGGTWVAVLLLLARWARATAIWELHLAAAYHNALDLNTMKKNGPCI